MQVILLEEDRVVKVADGYARNFLMPKKLAIPATPAAIKLMERRADANKHKREEIKKAAQETADKLTSQEVIIRAEAGEEGKLFGTVTNQDVIQGIFETFKIEVDKRKVNLNEHIKAIGDYKASVKLHTEVVAHVKLRVVKK